jgi:hypothetical protein
MADFVTLEQLLNAPPGTVIEERRGAVFQGLTVGGKPIRAEYRTASATTPDDFWERLERLERQGRELLEG